MRIAVLRGGPSNHYESSLKSGEEVLKSLRNSEKFKPIDVLISRDGEWFVNGRRQSPEKALRLTDAVWNALHGEYGEDGEATRVLSGLGLSHTGSTSHGLALTINKDLAKKAFEAQGFLVPKHTLVHGDVSVRDLLKIFRSHIHPLMVKPVRGRSSLGVKKVHSFEELQEAVAEAFRYADRVILEEYVRGVEARCAVLDNFRGEKLYATTPLPSSFTKEVHRRMEEIAKKAHEALGLRHYSLVDFIITPKGKIYLLEVNALPDLHSDSNFISSLENIGLKHRDFIEHVLSLKN